MFSDLASFIYDYIEFCYGGMYFLMAVFAAFLYKNNFSKSQGTVENDLPKLPWHIFAYAIMLYGLPNWIAIFALPFREMTWILPFVYVVIVISCLTLFKFASASSEILCINNNFSSKYLVYMLALCFVGSLIDIRIGAVVAHLLVVIPPVVQGFLVFYKLNKVYKYKYIYLYGVFFLFYLFFRFIDYYKKTSSLVNIRQFIEILIPSNSIYHLISVSFFVIAALCFIKFAKDQLKEKNFVTHSISFPVVVVLGLIAGVVFTGWRLNYTNNMFKTTLTRIASGIVRAINAEKLNSYLYGKHENNVNDRFSWLAKTYESFSAIPIKPDGVFTLRKERDKFYVNTDGNLLKNGEFTSKYDVEYVENHEHLFDAIKNMTPVVVGPYRNLFGNYITAYVPYKLEESEKKIQILGADIEADKWYAIMGRISTSSLLYLMFLIAFPVVAFVTNVTVKYSNLRIRWLFDSWYSIALEVCIFMCIAIPAIAYFATDYNLIINRQNFYCLADSKGQAINEAISRTSSEIKWILANASNQKVVFNNKHDFDVFAEKVLQFGDIKNLRLINAVPGRFLKIFEEEARKLNNYDEYRICSYIGTGYDKIPEPQNLFRVYWPALYTYPKDDVSLGFNYFSLPILRKAIDVVLKTRKICVVIAPRENLDRFAGELMAFAPAQFASNGNITSMFVAFIDFQEIIDKINTSAYNDNLNYDYEIFVENSGKQLHLASYPKNPDEERINTWKNASLGYIYPIFAMGRNLSVKVYPKANYSYSDFWTTNTFLVTAMAGIVFALVFSIFFISHHINQKRLEVIYESKLSDVEKREGLIQEITENLPVVSFRIKKNIKDKKYDTVFVNREINKLTGIPVSDFMSGKYSITDILSGEDFSSLNSLIEEALSEHRPIETEGRIRNLKTDQTLWAYVRAIPVFDVYGSLKWIDGFITDISEEKAVELRQRSALEKLEEINATLKEKSAKAKVLALQVESSNSSNEAFKKDIYQKAKAPAQAINERSNNLIKTDLSVEQMDYAKIIANNSQGIVNILEEILDGKEAKGQIDHTSSDTRV